MKSINLALVIVCLFLIGCSSSTGNFGKYYNKAPNSPKLKSNTVENVRVERMRNWSEIARRVDQLAKQGFRCLGDAQFEGPVENESCARALTAKLGGDVVLVISEFVGQRDASRMVVGSYTPGRTVSARTDTQATSQAFGSASYSGNQYYGNASASAHGLYSGSSNTNIYIPPETTYVRESFTYDAFAQAAIFYASPERIAEAQSK